jgi:hypothetical protein
MFGLIGTADHNKQQRSHAPGGCGRARRRQGAAARSARRRRTAAVAPGVPTHAHARCVLLARRRASRAHAVCTTWAACAAAGAAPRRRALMLQAAGRATVPVKMGQLRAVPWRRECRLTHDCLPGCADATCAPTTRQRRRFRQLRRRRWRITAPSYRRLAAGRSATPAAVDTTQQMATRQNGAATTARVALHVCVCGAHGARPGYLSAPAAACRAAGLAAAVTQHARRGSAGSAHRVLVWRRRR